MQTSAPDTHTDLRDALRALCAQFPPEYHRKFGENETYPEEFVDALTREGWLAAMIPEEYGGSGLGLTEASIIMEEVNRCGGNAGHCHGQMYNMGTLLRHGSDEQKQKYLPGIASGALRLQSMAVTEPTTGTDTTKLKTTAVKKGDRYEINGQKVWISRIQHSDLMILLARTTPLDEVKKKSQGLSIFMVDLKEAIGNGMEVRPIANMPGHETNEVFFDSLEIPAENLIGTEGRVELSGEDVTGKRVDQIARSGLARTFQGTHLFAGQTVVENIMIGRHTLMESNVIQAFFHFGPVMREEARHREAAEEIIDFLEIEAIRNKPVGTLGYGLRKRVDLGRALAQEPSILLMDEPMAGMNSEEKEDLARFILDVREARKIPVVLVEHDMGVVMDLADRVVVLDFGRVIAEGTPEEIQKNPAVIKAYLG